MGEAMTARRITATERAIIKAAEYWRTWSETRAVQYIVGLPERELAEAVDADRKAKRGK